MSVKKTEKTKYILAIDPGVLLGYMGIQVLEAIEVKTGKRISDLVDFIGGTSTGAIIAALLTLDEVDLPQYSATDARKLYEKFGPEIFARQTQALGEFLSKEEADTLKSHFFDQFFSATLSMLPGIKAEDHISIQNAIATQNATNFKRAVEQACAASPECSKLSAKDKYIEHLAQRMESASDLITSPYFYDATLFRQVLREHLGTNSRVAKSSKPIAIFCERSALRPGEKVISSLKGMGGMSLEMMPKSPDVIAFSATNDTDLVAAVYASWAALVLFPPHEIEVLGQRSSYSDGDVFGFSTLAGTIKEARVLWPDAPFEVIYVNFGRKGLDEDTQFEGVTVHRLNLYEDWLGPNADGRDASSQNFELMCRITANCLAGNSFLKVLTVLNTRKDA